VVTHLLPFAFLLQPVEAAGQAVQPPHRAGIHRIKEIGAGAADEPEEVAGAAGARLPAVKVPVQLGHDHQHVVAQIGQIGAAGSVKQLMPR